LRGTTGVGVFESGGLRRARIGALSDPTAAVSGRQIQRDPRFAEKFIYFSLIRYFSLTHSALSKMHEKIYLRKWTRRDWLVTFTIVVVGIAVFIWSQTNSSDDITGSLSKTEPPLRRDGTPTHPYADDGRCPPSTDLVIWPREGRSPPSVPPEISVCFVENQSLNDNHR
jgi:hypothetical protein